MIGAQPVLIDFAASIFERGMYDAENGSALQRDVSRRSIGSRLHRLTFGGNPVAVSNSTKFIGLLKQETLRPVVLVVGGGAVGLGADELYRDDSIELVGTDVYASPHTVLVADAHKLPFDDGGFDGVWVQAVLEHVLEPATAVAELHRVLRPEGLVYAETPFMQQVHERAYDFSRSRRAVTAGCSGDFPRSAQDPWAAPAWRWHGRSAISRARSARATSCHA